MGKIAVVTGASKGIGRACALRLAKDGMTVVVNYSHSDAEAAKTVEEIKQRVVTQWHTRLMCQTLIR